MTKEHLEVDTSIIERELCAMFPVESVPGGSYPGQHNSSPP